MLEKQLSQAFVLTSEEQAEMFERFANAFLIDDYPNWKVSVGRGIRGWTHASSRNLGRTYL